MRSMASTCGCFLRSRNGRTWRQPALAWAYITASTLSASIAASNSRM